MDLNLAPVTLVVKAPNQKIDDQVVECGLGWTIQKLKRHLSTVYPNKPLENQQKLIYSGRLLKDDLLLKDVLRQYEDDQTTHTMHLVCAGADQPTSHSTTPSPKSSSPSPPAAPVTNSSTDGLRHRTATTSTAPSAQPATSQSFPMQQPYTNMQQMYQGVDPMQMMYGGYYPGGQMMGMTAEQMQWMQQLYTQQMQQYMQYQQQYYQQAGYPMASYGGAYPATSTTSPPAGVQPVDPQVPAANDEPQPIRMNAQGGPMADDEEPGRARDWLDGLYTMARFAVIISIVYFNSSLSRFLVVLGVSVLFYAYQHVWPKIRQQRLERERRQQQQLEEQRQAAAAAEREASDQNAAQENEGSQNDETDGAVSDEATTEAAEPPPPPPPSALQVTWSFFSSFFSSLIPAQPPAVNAN